MAVGLKGADVNIIIQFTDVLLAYREMLAIDKDIAIGPPSAAHAASAVL